MKLFWTRSKLIHLFVALCIGFAPIWLAPELFAQNENTEVGLPSWLIGSSFKLRHRLETELDGSEEAKGLKRRSETLDQVVFKDVQNWRALREDIFRKTSREVLQTPQGSFVLTPSNRKVSAGADYSDRFWAVILEYPFELSRRWGFFIGARDWNDWFNRISEVTEDLENAEGDRIRVQISEQPSGVKRVSLLLEGHLVLSGRTKTWIRSEWVLELNSPITDSDLSQSLFGGRS